MPKYQGPADVFYLEAGGKPYRLGDNVPISEKSARHMGQRGNGGHLFEGIEVEQVTPTPADLATARARAEADKA